MILDPRMVPWDNVIPGAAVGLLVALAALLFWQKWRRAALFVMAAAPVAGWALSVYLLHGRLPDLPPVDATQWTFYFAVAAVPVAALALWTGHRRWWWVAAAVIALLYDAALWAAIFRPVAGDEPSPMEPLQAAALALAAVGVWLALSMRKTPLWLSAEYAPWLVALGAASACLGLTGTASVSFLAVGLCVSALPAAVIVLAQSRRPHTRPPARLQAQAITLSLAFALPGLMCAGPLYASTTWSVACLVLAVPLVGTLVIRLGAALIARRNSKEVLRSDYPGLEPAGILVGFVAAALPAGIAVFKVVQAAANEVPYY